MFAEKEFFSEMIKKYCVCYVPFHYMAQYSKNLNIHYCNYVHLFDCLFAHNSKTIHQSGWVQSSCIKSLLWVFLETINECILHSHWKEMLMRES